MSRGRKAKSNNSNLGWQQVFSKNVGKYLQYAIMEFSKVENHAAETGQDLLKRIKEEKGKNKKEKELPAIKASEIPYEIPKNWVWCRLGEIAEIVRGGSPRPAGDPTFYGGDIPFLKVGDLTGYEDIYVRTYEHSIKEAGLHKTRFVEADTLMLTNSGATLGIPRICTFPTTFNDGIAAFLNLNDIDKVYLYYFLKSKSAWYLKEASRGQGQPNLNTDIIALTPFPLPPLNIQTQIVDFLTDFENENLKEDGYYFHQEVEQKVIALHEAQLKGVELANELTHQLTLVKSLRQQLLQDAVQGKLVAQHPEDEPASVLLEKIKAEKEKLIAEKKFKKDKPLPPIKPEEIPFEIPGGWVWCRLGEVIYDTEGGKSPNCLHEPVKDGEWGVIKTTAVQEMHFLENENKVLPSNFIVSEQHKILEGDIIITRAGPKNRVGIVCCVENVSKNLILSDKTIRIKHFKQLLFNKFIALALNSPIIKPYIEQKMTGMADSQVNISQDNMKGFPIPLPPLSEQARIVQKLEELMQYCDGLEAGIQDSVVQNERLLQQVLREALRERLKTNP